MRPVLSFLKLKGLIDDQRDGTEAEPMQNPFLPAKLQISAPEDQANQRARRKRETEDAAEPLLGRAAPAWHRVTKTLKNSKRTTLLRKRNPAPFPASLALQFGFALPHRLNFARNPKNGRKQSPTSVSRSISSQNTH